MRSTFHEDNNKWNSLAHKSRGFQSDSDVWSTNPKQGGATNGCGKGVVVNITHCAHGGRVWPLVDSGYVKSLRSVIIWRQQVELCFTISQPTDTIRKGDTMCFVNNRWNIGGYAQGIQLYA